jgi:ABC-type branched-subunit amino acid transport system substrate-binding protein
MKVVSVFGPFGSQALVHMSSAEAAKLVETDVAATAPAYVIEAVSNDLFRLPVHLHASAMAATARAMAFELSNPYNSATSKAQCAKVLADVMERLLLSVPEEEEADELDRIAGLGESAA